MPFAVSICKSGKISKYLKSDSSGGSLVFFFTKFYFNSSNRSTNGNLYFQMFEDLLIALENLEEQDHKKRGGLLFVKT